MIESRVRKDSYNQCVASGKQQRGVVLVIALIMLLLLTMIGIAGIRDTQLQEKMAGSAQDRELALQAAESALRVAEALVKAPAGVNPPPPCANGYPQVPANRVELTYWQNFNWAAGTPAPAVPGVTTAPRYVIEQYPVNYTQISGTRNVTNQAKDRLVVDYLITARGTGVTNNAVVILQSMYRCVGS